MLWICVICSVLLAVHIEAGKLEPYSQSYSLSAIKCIVDLCENYYETDENIIGTLLVVHIRNVTLFHDQLMKTVMERNTYAIDLINQSTCCKEESYNKIVEKARNYLVVFEELNEVTAALHLWRELPTWNPLARFVAVFLKIYDDKTLHRYTRFILEAFFESNALNVKVMSHRLDANVIQMHTWFPYEGTNCACGVRNIHLINECRFSDSRNESQFVRHITSMQPVVPVDLHGCPLRVAASVYGPYVYYDPIQKDFKNGIEVHLIRTIAQALNMTPVFIGINETRDNRIVSNETGIYSMLLKRYRNE